MHRACLPFSLARRQRGVTVVESLVAAAIGALVLGLGTTSVLALAAGEQQSAGARALVASLEFARTAAIARRVAVAVCGIEATDGEPALGSVRCVDGARAWTNGWAVFEDANRNDRIDAGETVLHVESARRTEVIATAVAHGAPRAAVSFRPIGALDHSTPILLAVTSRGGEPARRVCVGTDATVRILLPKQSCG